MFGKPPACMIGRGLPAKTPIGCIFFHITLKVNFLERFQHT
tara:strand:+ start:13039 stop:13161 length:123 start_codon:yes stop_codon:yes gene_type:complete